MSDLEQRYRHALRWYPRRWRAQHEEALVGILLDQAEEEGRTRMSSADRRDLTRQGLRRRLAPVLLGVLLALAGLAAFQAGIMLTDHIGLGARLFVVLHPVSIGSRWVTPVEIAFSSGTLYLICAGSFIAASVGAIVLAARLLRVRASLR